MVTPARPPAGPSPINAFTGPDGQPTPTAHEVLYLQDRPGGMFCPLYDGLTYGDRDGILTDEVVEITQGGLCQVMEACGFTSLNQPAIRVEATDCGGQVGTATRRLRGAMTLLPGACEPEEPGRAGGSMTKPVRPRHHR